MKLRREGVVNERVADRNEVEAPNPVSRSYIFGRCNDESKSNLRQPYFNSRKTEILVQSNVLSFEFD